MNEERPIVFTIIKATSNFGGLFCIKTKDARYAGSDYIDVGVSQLFETLEEISEDLNDKGYAVLFEVD